eukprot:GHVQ01000430.1.p1 GENE.GHVQ01000430.1~~GHVQ01000430.1.p1  ORF type:complete len:315 (-),score=52.68 GHVQ01000430.1:586-1530(-)
MSKVSKSLQVLSAPAIELLPASKGTVSKLTTTGPMSNTQTQGACGGALWGGVIVTKEGVRQRVRGAWGQGRVWGTGEARRVADEREKGTCVGGGVEDDKRSTKRQRVTEPEKVVTGECPAVSITDTKSQKQVEEAIFEVETYKKSLLCEETGGKSDGGLEEENRGVKRVRQEDVEESMRKMASVKATMRNTNCSPFGVESHSAKYYDTLYEYKHITLTEEQFRRYCRMLHFVRKAGRKYLTEAEIWDKVGVQQSPGWEQYSSFDMYPQVLYCRRRLPHPISQQEAKKRSQYSVLGWDAEEDTEEHNTQQHNNTR